ncbi:Charged multivesicular body protein 1a [Phlyctochytrium bullatum]|nr:Charged multivesicular body protein 1a [Phlyctochytrium bullatum]
MDGFDKHLIQFKLEREAKKATRNEKNEKDKLKKAIQLDNMEGAKIYASNAIRKRNESLGFLRLASRLDAVASRFQTAVTMRRITASMAEVVKNMERAMKAMNLEQISRVMEKFESQFEDLDVQTSYIESSIGQTTALTTPQSQVDELIQKVADENNLEVRWGMPGTIRGSVGTLADKEHQNLTERLARLRRG